MSHTGPNTSTTNPATPPAPPPAHAPADESVAGEEDPGAGLDGSEDAADAAPEIPKVGAARSH